MERTENTSKTNFGNVVFIEYEYQARTALPAPSRALQEMVERSYVRWCMEVGVPAEVLKDERSFWALLEWVGERPELREKLVKTGWKSWKQKWREKAFKTGF